MSYSQKFYIADPSRFGRFVGKKWINVNNIIRNTGVRADKGEDSRGVHIKLSANRADRHQVDKALRLLQQRQSAPSRPPASSAGRHGASSGRPRPPASARYSQKFYVETHVLQPEVDFARFVGKRWNNINKIIKSVKSSVTSNDDPSKTIKRSFVRADKGEDQRGLYIVLSAPLAHRQKVDMALRLLHERQQKRTGTKEQLNSYRPAAPRPASQCKGPIEVRRQRPTTSTPRPKPRSRPMTPKPAMTMPPPPPAEAIVAGLAIGKALREKTSFDVTRCSDPARTEQPTQATPQQDTKWQSWIEDRSNSESDKFSLFAAPMPFRKSVVTVADVARGLADLPATTGSKSAPGSTAASVTGVPSYPASVASDRSSPVEEYPSLPVPATRVSFCPTSCMLKLNGPIRFQKQRVVQKKRVRNDRRDCKGSFAVGALQMGNKALERHLGDISQKVTKRLGSAPGFFITGRNTSRKVTWTVRGTHVHNAFREMLQKWYTRITAPRQICPAASSTPSTASEAPMSVEEWDAWYEAPASDTPTVPEINHAPGQATPFFSDNEKKSLTTALKRALREEALTGAIPSLRRHESHQAWSPTRTEPW